MKGARIATVALCMLLLVLPSVAIPIFRSPDSGAENRELADFPALIDGEDGFGMFRGCKVLQDRVKLDNLVLIDYIAENLGGVISDDYENPFGQGRIVFKENP
jgi:hypothetical protein